MTRYRVHSIAARWVASLWPPCGRARLEQAASLSQRHAQPPDGQREAT